MATNKVQIYYNQEVKGHEKISQLISCAVTVMMLFSLFSTFPVSATSVNKPIIILKIDDLCNDNVANFQKCFEILQSYDINNAGFGIIGEHLEDSKVTSELISGITLWNSAGIEIWHHGYVHQESEFNSSSDYNTQKESFRKTCDLLYQKTGITITSFGSPWNNANETTVRVIEENFPQIKCLMLVNATTSITNVRARANIETSVGVVNYDTFVSNYNAKLSEDAVILQGHAGVWDDNSREEFKKVLTFLQGQNATFMTPSQYADYVGEQVVEPKREASECFNTSKSGVGSTWSQDTVTDNGNSSWTVSGSVGSGDNWIKHRTEFGLNGFDGVAMGSGVAQKIGHVGWTMSNPNGHEIRVSYTYNSSSRVELAKWNMSTGEVTDQIDTNFVAIVTPRSYQGDFFIDLETKAYRLYFDNILFSEGYVSGSTFKNLILNVPGQGSNFNYSFTISNVTRDVYDSGTTMNDVVAYTFANRGTDNYCWSVSGYGNVGGTNGKRLVGSEDWVVNDKEPDYDGNNVIIKTHASNSDSGYSYRLRILNSNGTHKAKGCLPQDDENDNVIHQSLDITPHLTGSNYGAIGFKGNNNPQRNKYKFGADNGFVSGNTYHFDILVNNKDKEYWIFVDGEKRATGASIGDAELSGFVYTIGTAGSDTLVLSNIVTKSYKSTVSMDDAIAIVKSSSNYRWIFDGIDTYNNSIASGYSTPSNKASLSGTNAGGYTIYATTDGAYFGYRLGNGNKVALARVTGEENVIHQHLKFTPIFASGHTQDIGVRGNDKYHYLCAISAANGFVSGKEYDMNFIIDNKDFTYYIIFDGTIKSQGNIDPGRSPLWEISYLMNNADDSMVLKNISTKYYNNTVTKADIAALSMTKVYVEIESIAAEGRTITANTKFMGPTTGTNSKTKALYALYDNAGMLVKLNVVNSAASLINGSADVQSFAIPDNAEAGDNFKIKAFMWNMDTLTPLSNCSEAAYTVE